MYTRGGKSWEVGMDGITFSAQISDYDGNALDDLSDHQKNLAIACFIDSAIELCDTTEEACEWFEHALASLEAGMWEAEGCA